MNGKETVLAHNSFKKFCFESGEKIGWELGKM